METLLDGGGSKATATTAIATVSTIPMRPTMRCILTHHSVFVRA